MKSSSVESCEMAKSGVRLFEMLEDLEAKHEVCSCGEVVDASVLETDSREACLGPVERGNIDVETGIVERDPRVIPQELIHITVRTADLDNVPSTRAQHRPRYGPQEAIEKIAV